MQVVLIGTFLKGFSVFGPFLDQFLAYDWAMAYRGQHGCLLLDSEWQIIPLRKPNILFIMTDQQHAVIAGNPLIGFSVLGPFPDMVTAQDWAIDSHLGRMGWALPLQVPFSREYEHDQCNHV